MMMLLLVCVWCDLLMCVCWLLYGVGDVDGFCDLCVCGCEIVCWGVFCVDVLWCVLMWVWWMCGCGCVWGGCVWGCEGGVIWCVGIDWGCGWLECVCVCVCGVFVLGVLRDGWINFVVVGVARRDVCVWCEWWEMMGWMGSLSDFVIKCLLEVIGCWWRWCFIRDVDGNILCVFGKTRVWCRWRGS